jgi:hypothetical protein
MKKEVVLKKLESHIEKIQDTLDDISSLLELDIDDEELAEMSVTFKEQIEYAISENSDCNYNDIVDYIRENL